jgi:hypothetical protein
LPATKKNIDVFRSVCYAYCHRRKPLSIIMPRATRFFARCCCQWRVIGCRRLLNRSRRPRVGCLPSCRHTSPDICCLGRGRGWCLLCVGSAPGLRRCCCWRASRLVGRRGG